MWGGTAPRTRLLARSVAIKSRLTILYRLQESFDLKSPPLRSCPLWPGFHRVMQIEYRSTNTVRWSGEGGGGGVGSESAQ